MADPTRRYGLGALWIKWKCKKVLEEMWKFSGGGIMTAVAEDEHAVKLISRTWSTPRLSERKYMMGSWEHMVTNTRSKI